MEAAPSVRRLLLRPARARCQETLDEMGRSIPDHGLHYATGDQTQSKVQLEIRRSTLKKNAEPPLAHPPMGTGAAASRCSVSICGNGAREKK
jgi:hypothetical protein